APGPERAAADPVGAAGRDRRHPPLAALTISAPGRFRLEDDARAGGEIVPGTTLAVEQRPPESQPGRQPGQDGNAEADGGLPEGRAATVCPDQPQPPCPHAQRLSGLEPEAGQE